MNLPFNAGERTVLKGKNFSHKIHLFTADLKQIEYNKRKNFVAKEFV